MWYIFAQNEFNQINEISKEVAKMDRYDPRQHLNMLSLPVRPGELNNDATMDERWDKFHDKTVLYREYNAIHPQIYLFPSESIGKFRYFIFDPKHLKVLENEDYHETLTTPIPLDSGVEEAIDWCHKQYPTAYIDNFET